MSFSPLIERLIRAFRCLPGIGPKSAQRMVFHLLERARAEGLALAEGLEQTLRTVRHCQRCRILSEAPVCAHCANPKRDTALLCVVESPADVAAIEQTRSYQGYYFVLRGRLSPLDGIGPKELGIHEFLSRIQEDTPEEVILATSSTVEGEATAHYLSELLKERPIRLSRIAHGIPLGNELEFVDSNTLMRALAARKTLPQAA